MQEIYWHLLHFIKLKYCSLFTVYNVYMETAAQSADCKHRMKYILLQSSKTKLLPAEDQETGHRPGNASSFDTHIHTPQCHAPPHTQAVKRHPAQLYVCVTADCCVSTPGKEQLSPSCFQLLKLEFSPLCYTSMIFLHVLFPLLVRHLSICAESVGGLALQI